MKLKNKLLFLPLIAAVLLGLCACDDSPHNSAYKYDDAKYYTAGSGTVSSAVNEIDVDWVAGDIDISASDEATEIAFTEQTDLTDEKYAMHWRLDGSVLKIKYVKSGTVPEPNMKKTLSVTIPASFTLRELDVDSVSGNVALNNVKTADCELETLSGNISLTNVTAPVLHAESVSGKITAGEGVYGDVEFETVSGDITLENGSSPLRSFEAESVSGKVRLWARRCPSLVEIETTSGKAELIFSEGAGFTLTFHTVSGKFESQFETTKNGNVYTAAGEGNGSIRVDTTSGNVTVTKILNE